MKQQEHITTSVQRDVHPKVIAMLKKIIADKQTIHEHLSNGGTITELEAKGFKFVRPL